MADSLAHRGPDDAGAWVDVGSGVALGHRRLSVVDLSPLGHQPMLSHCERYVLTFNGEIYNYLELRTDLESRGIQFRGTSDTEVLLAALAHWGVAAALRRTNGMFAFALWDRSEQALTLARDRAGEKPLYYAALDGCFLFGSELKALCKHPRFSREIDRSSLVSFMRHGYVPCPYSIYRCARKLPPATFIQYRRDCVDLTPTPYWSLSEAARTGDSSPFEGSPGEMLDELDRLLRRSIRARMHADVPLGAFLSGGVDSSTVVALMQAQSSRPIKTFTIGLHEAAFDEAEQAGLVAAHLGTEHTVLYVTPAEAHAVIPALPTMYDEPFADSSQIPTFLVSRLARRHVTVALSGDGGDEVFAGYIRYQWLVRAWNMLGRVPHQARSVLARMLTLLSSDQWDNVLGRADSWLPSWARQRNPGNKLHKLARILPLKDARAMYFSLVSQWQRPAELVLGARERGSFLLEDENWIETSDLTGQLMHLDIATYLPDDILVKVDRASMAASLEARVPFLDHEVIEFGRRIRPELRIRDGQLKWPLRHVLYRYVPRSLIERPKMGFGLPLHAWLRGPLRDWADDLLEPDRMRREGYLDPNPIRKMWLCHLSGKLNCEEKIWPALMFQSWLQEWSK